MQQCLIVIFGTVLVPIWYYFNTNFIPLEHLYFSFSAIEATWLASDDVNTETPVMGEMPPHNPEVNVDKHL